MIKIPVKKYAETRRTWREKLNRRNLKKPFVRKTEDLNNDEREVLRKWDLLPIEEVSAKQLARYTKVQLGIYCRIYGVRLDRKDAMIQELIQRRDFLNSKQGITPTEQQTNFQSRELEADSFDVANFPFHSPFEFYLQIPEKKKGGRMNCKDLSNLTYLCFELFQTGRTKDTTPLLPILLRRPKTLARVAGFNREISLVAFILLAHRDPKTLIQLLRKLIQSDNLERTVYLQRTELDPTVKLAYNSRSLLELEEGRLSALTELIFIRWHLRDYQSAVDDIGQHLSHFPFFKYKEFLVLLAAFHCLEAYRQLNFDEELTSRDSEESENSCYIHHMFPFNFHRCWQYLLHVKDAISQETNLALNNFESALSCLKKFEEHQPLTNTAALLYAIVLANCRTIAEAVSFLEDYLARDGQSDSYILENYLLCLGAYKKSLADSVIAQEVLQKQVSVTQHILLNVDPFSSLAFSHLADFLDNHLVGYIEMVDAVASHLDFLGNMESHFLSNVLFWKKSFQLAWFWFAQLLNLCEDDEIDHIWKENERVSWWPIRFFSVQSLEEDLENYPELIPHKLHCIRKLIGSLSEYEMHRNKLFKILKIVTE
eukprot:jgi/Galph1/5647/GphlegSOOS_G4256.1